MAITTTICDSFKTDILAGTHVAADVYKIALYTSSATLGAATTAYSATNEVSGTGYTATGMTLVGYTPGFGSGVAWIDWTTDPTWTTATITARGALIYNSSKSNKAVATFDFGADVTSTASDFVVPMPASAAGTAVIRIA